jgi:hypothetical protein
MSIRVPPTPEMVSARSPRQAACLSPISVENGSQVSKGGNLFQRVFFGTPKVHLFVPQVMSKYVIIQRSLSRQNYSLSSQKGRLHETLKTLLML